MNFKTTYVLFGLLIAVLVVFLVVQLAGRKGPDTATYVFPSLHTKTASIKPKDIDTVEIELHRPESEKMVFVRTEQGWRLREPNVRADAGQLDQLVRQVMDAQIDEKAEVTSNQEQFGLKPPAAVVTLVQKGGEARWTLNVGTVGSGFDALAFVNSSERPNEVLAVRRGDLSALLKGRDAAGAEGQRVFKTLNDYRARDLLAQHAFDIQYVRLQGKPGEVILKKPGTENRWVFEKPDYGEADYSGDPGRDDSPQGVQGLLANLANLKVESPQDFVTVTDDARELAKYGLDKDNPERMRIEVKTQDTLSSGEEKKPPVTSVLLVGKKVDDKEDKYYAALDEGEKYPKAVVKIAGRLRDQIYQLLQNPNPLRSRDLVTLETGQVDKIDWIEVNNGSETFQLQKTGAGSWDLIDKTGKVRKADGNVVERLLDVVKERRQIRDYPEESKTDAELGLDRPSAVVSFWVESQKKEPEKKEADKKSDEKKEADKKEPEKKDAKDAKAADKDVTKEEKKAPAKPEGPPTVRLVFGKKDKDIVYVLREMGKDKLRAAVAEALLTKVTQDKLAYLDRRLPDFPKDKVVKLTLLRDGQTYEIQKEEKDGKVAWKFQRPEALAGRTAEEAKVKRILDDLAAMYADKLLAENVSASDLERYGLKAPPLKVTLTVKQDDKTEERVYEFGKEADDKSGRLHARTSERDWIFLVGAHLTAPLKEELADTTVFTFEGNKVKAVQMAGWAKVIGSPWKFDLERKAKGSWTVKTPENYKLDEGKVEKLVEALSKLKAMKFVAHKSGAKPEHGLKVSEGALEIQVTVEGEKEPYLLTVGALSTADKGYYATSNKLPGDVFLLPEAMFAEILKGPVYFAASTAGK
ncbi:MAG TPA: DUF4340 domain-containing protein [Gemmataceae bacterium]|nr:DUF4340 domain-containing protein [Gemmataceae bacterium]